MQDDFWLFIGLQRAMMRRKSRTKKEPAEKVINEIRFVQEALRGEEFGFLSARSCCFRGIWWLIGVKV